MPGEWLAAVVDNRGAHKAWEKPKTKNISHGSDDDCDCGGSGDSLPLWVHTLLYGVEIEEL